MLIGRRGPRTMRNRRVPRRQWRYRWAVIVVLVVLLAAPAGALAEPTVTIVPPPTIGGAMLTGDPGRRLGSKPAKPNSKARRSNAPLTMGRRAPADPPCPAAQRRSVPATGPPCRSPTASTISSPAGTRATGGCCSQAVSCSRSTRRLPGCSWEAYRPALGTFLRRLRRNPFRSADRRAARMLADPPWRDPGLVELQGKPECRTHPRSAAAASASQLQLLVSRHRPARALQPGGQG